MGATNARHYMQVRLIDQSNNRPWDPKAWETINDSLRGGSSTSYLSAIDADPSAVYFHGHLDTTTLGGAGFASQQHTCDSWDLSAHDGLLLELGALPAGADDHGCKRYTVTLKNQVTPRGENGRSRSTLTWQAEFEHPPGAAPSEVWLPWESFKPTYRGRPVDGAPAAAAAAAPLDLHDVKRVGIMMRR
ncbi:hypothetical protein ACRE_051000 [Hapsidospora chrysogenum ATCC 11550]|uniref:NADH:ubiquinone oxidoreductase intermediate-associated protein 30 domain-containing protein n=1 Tax=Hapsidospora chrysogenum (strain ATCC 11550 / CBS 779.69 / DSM 880 / IAM 14645 / JCM 23072 / IMI 49137) TaxID=857340 RepID=A0A086T423_HAPC1|nr:hypothetical protein ACRE_051000 [Hapsidospora chrysogenum ATCC 11550]